MLGAEVADGREWYPDEPPDWLFPSFALMFPPLRPSGGRLEERDWVVGAGSTSFGDC